MTRTRVLAVAILALALSISGAGQTYVAELRLLLGLKNSELGEIVHRYTADRAAMLRRFDAPYSPMRREQLRGFYMGWRAALPKIDFASLGQPARVD